MGDALNRQRFAEPFASPAEQRSKTPVRPLNLEKGRILRLAARPPSEPPCSPQVAESGSALCGGWVGAAPKPRPSSLAGSGNALAKDTISDEAYGTD